MPRVAPVSWQIHIIFGHVVWLQKRVGGRWAQTHAPRKYQLNLEVPSLEKKIEDDEEACLASTFKIFKA